MNHFDSKHSYMNYYHPRVAVYGPPHAELEMRCVDGSLVDLDEFAFVRYKNQSYNESKPK
jgi:hypothetical protein